MNVGLRGAFTMQRFTIYNAQRSWTVYTLMVVCYIDSYLIGIHTEIVREDIWTYTRILGRLYPDFGVPDKCMVSRYDGMGWLIQLMFS